LTNTLVKEKYQYLHQIECQAVTSPIRGNISCVNCKGCKNLLRDTVVRRLQVCS